MVRLHPLFSTGVRIIAADEPIPHVSHKVTEPRLPEQHRAERNKRRASVSVIAADACHTTSTVKVTT